MATAKAVAGALALLAEAHPSRAVTPQTVQVYAGALRDLTDAQLAQAVDRATRTLKFFPSPAELLECAGANRPATVDFTALYERIAALGQYHPASGMSWPSYATVCDQVGHEVGISYALVGGARLFSGSQTTRDIARREFEQEYRSLLRERGDSALPLPVPPPVPQLASGTFHERPALTPQPGFRRIGAVLEERAS